MGLIFGSSGLFADKRIPKKRKIDTSSPKYKKMLRRIIHNRYDSEAMKWVAADKELKKYKKKKKKDEMWKRFEEVI